MDQEEFVATLWKQGVRSSRSILKELREGPPGEPNQITPLSQWFRGLSANDQEKIGALIAYSAWAATFGWFCELDGVGEMPGDPDDGMYQLHYVRGEEKVLLNSDLDPDLEELHGLLTAYDRLSLELPAEEEDPREDGAEATPRVPQEVLLSDLSPELRKLLEEAEEPVDPETRPFLDALSGLVECDPQAEQNPAVRAFKQNKLNGEGGLDELMNDIATMQAMLVVLGRGTDAASIGEAMVPLEATLGGRRTSEYHRERFREQIVGMAAFSLLLSGRVPEARALTDAWGTEEFGQRSRTSRKDLEGHYKLPEQAKDLRKYYEKVAEEWSFEDLGITLLEGVCRELAWAYVDLAILRLDLAGAERLKNAGLTIERIVKLISRLEPLARELLNAEG